MRVHPAEARMIACWHRDVFDMSFHYIAIEGQIAAGKTALAERLATRLDAHAMR